MFTAGVWPSKARALPLRTFVHGSLARVCCSLGRPRIKPSRRGSRGEHRAARRDDQPGRAVHLKAIAQSKRARRAPQGELARAVEEPRWAAQDMRQPRISFACASRRPRCSSRSIAVRNNALTMARSFMPWLVRCRWGSLLCAGTVSFQVAVVESQRRAAGRRSHVRCESRRMSGSREEGRIAKLSFARPEGPA